MTEYIVSFDGIEFLWMDNDYYAPEYHMEQMGTIAVVEFCGC